MRTKAKLTIAGLLTATYSVGASIIRVLGGVLADRLGGEIMAIGMGVANAAIFKLVPQEVKQAVGGAAGWVGGLGAFGGFAIPPLLGAFVRAQGASGYATGFVIFVVLGVVSLALAFTLRATTAKPSSQPAGH
jgi:NNP family nitrate/nitrite transporter-like MFS transporter